MLLAGNSVVVSTFDSYEYCMDLCNESCSSSWPASRLAGHPYMSCVAKTLTLDITPFNHACHAFWHH